jgi:hypothetical protein
MVKPELIASLPFHDNGNSLNSQSILPTNKASQYGNIEKEISAKSANSVLLRVIRD